MKILLTGHKGFIGSYVYWKLRSRGHEVVGIDKKDGDDLLKMDLPDMLFDVVIHCAANLFDNYQDNIKMTGKLVNRFSSVDRFIFTSSAAVYGNCNNAKETDALFPFGDYGAAKFHEESLIRNAFTIQDVDHEEVGHKYVIFRLGNVYGTGTDHGFYNECINGNNSVNYFDHIRDYVSVMDVSSAIVKAAVDLDYYNDGVYNLSTGVGTRNLDLYKKINRSSYPVLSGKEPEEIAVSVLNNERALTQGFHPRSL